MTRSRIKREAEFIKESSKAAEGSQSRKKLVSRPPRAVSPVSIETVSEEIGTTMEEPTSELSPSPGNVVGTSSRTPPLGPTLGGISDWTSGTPVEDFTRARISIAVNNLITQILPLGLPTDRVLVQDMNTSAPLMKKFLQAAFNKGTPSYVDFVLRANNFLSGLISLDMDPSPFLTHIQELGKLLISIEVVRKLRTEISLGSEVAAAQGLRMQYRGVMKELAEIQERCHVLQAQQENTDFEVVAAQLKVAELQCQLVEAQAHLTLLKSQKTDLGLELEAQKAEGVARTEQLSKLHHDHEHAQALSDRAVQLYDFLDQMERGSSKGIEELISRPLQP